MIPLKVPSKSMGKREKTEDSEEISSVSAKPPILQKGAAAARQPPYTGNVYAVYFS
jgi:hypothetical protein